MLDEAECLPLITSAIAVHNLKNAELTAQIRAWKIYIETKKIAKDSLDIRLTGKKEILIKRLVAIIDLHGSQAAVRAAAATAGKTAAEVTAAAMLAETDVIEVDDSESDDDDFGEELEGRVMDKWVEGFSSGQMGLTTVKKE